MKLNLSFACSVFSSSSVFWAFAKDSMSKSHLVMLSIRDMISAVMLSVPLMYSMSVVNWEMKSNCRH